MKRIDDLTGIMTAQEGERYSHEAPEPRPLFQLSDGSYPRITVEVEKDDAIEITPEEDSGEIHDRDRQKGPQPFGASSRSLSGIFLL